MNTLKASRKGENGNLGTTYKKHLFNTYVTFYSIAQA